MMVKDHGATEIGSTSNGQRRHSRAVSTRLWCCGMFAWLLFAGCASAPAPMIDADLEAFTTGVDGVLKVGMHIKEAKAALRSAMPPPSIDTEVVAPVPSANRAMRTRRFMIVWPTFERGTSLVLTLFCDREGTVVRWTTGILRDGK